MTAASLPTMAKDAVRWSIIFSVLMILAGLGAIIVPVAAGLAVTIFVGWMLVFGGVAHFVVGWQMRTAGALIWEMLVGILYVAVGGYVLLHPGAGLASLTLALAIFLLIEAALELTLGF